VLSVELPAQHVDGPVQIDLGQPWRLRRGRRGDLGERLDDPPAGGPDLGPIRAPTSR